MLINSVLNFGSANPTNFFQILWRGTERSSLNSKNWVKIFLKCSLPPIAVKLERAGTKILLH